MEESQKKAAELAAKHSLKTVHIIGVGDGEGNTVYAYLQPPSRAVLSRYMSMAEADPLGANELLLANTWLEGDERIRTDDSMFLGACRAISQIIQVREATLATFRK